MADKQTIEQLRSGFQEYFDTEGIELPDPIPDSGSLHAGGWKVRYIFGRDESDEPYVDFFAEHRMTNSRHVRVFADGHTEALENYRQGLVFDEETGDDWAKASEIMHTHNQRVTQILEEKNLLLD